MLNYYNLGIIIGMLVSVIIVYFIKKKYINENEFIYDERQQIIRGEAYKYAFFLMIFAVLFFSLFEIKLFDKTTNVFIPIYIGISVYTIYCIFNYAYFYRNMSKKKYIIKIFIILLFLYLTKNIFKINIIYIILLSVLLICLVIKYFIDKKEVD
ncbi:hypothetical protein [Caviibacter abscessus]|uniref:hypothetical protein n=1 Tax=Caviibacter abscessus TaxID=1766719 RepID=UPI000837FAAD|nr:hypothetical protein [Caviibacter abscessus]